MEDMQKHFANLDLCKKKSSAEEQLWTKTYKKTIKMSTYSTVE